MSHVDVLPENEAIGMDRPRLIIALGVLAPMIVGLMALGAGVRAMNAGLACPDWPLCFGKVIPDFHVGVYFEFIHRAYAGMVSLFFVYCLISAVRLPDVSRSVKALGWAGLALLAGQIVMGGLTVLQLLKTVVVTSHLLLATLFFSCVLWMFILLRAPGSAQARRPPRGWRALAAAFPALVLAQIALGGLVAASYAGSVCVDFPLCNGEWVPTFRGGIGLQIMHRFGAYLVVASAFAIAVAVRAWRDRAWVSPAILQASGYLAMAAFVQMTVGIANLVLHIPPLMTVLHQSMAILTLTAAYWLAWVSWRRPVSNNFTVV